MYIYRCIIKQCGVAWMGRKEKQNLGQQLTSPIRTHNHKMHTYERVSREKRSSSSSSSSTAAAYILQAELNYQATRSQKPPTNHRPPQYTVVVTSSSHDLIGSFWGEKPLRKKAYQVPARKKAVECTTILLPLTNCRYNRNTAAPNLSSKAFFPPLLFLSSPLSGGKNPP